MMSEVAWQLMETVDLMQWRLTLRESSRLEVTKWKWVGLGATLIPIKGWSQWVS